MMAEVYLQISAAHQGIYIHSPPGCSLPNGLGSEVGFWVRPLRAVSPRSRMPSE